MKNKKFRQLAVYYKPHLKVFFADLFFSILAALTAVTIPLLVRYIQTNLTVWNASVAVRNILLVVAVMLALLLIEMYSTYFISYYGHVMGAKIEYDMRNRLFSHYQELSFSFFDNQKVGQLMSRVTNDLFDISEMLHHGPEEVVISAIKLFGSLTVLLIINWKLALVAFLPVPFMLAFAVSYNHKMKKAFVRNRARIADVNATIEDSLSGIRVVQSFANEKLEVDKFKRDNASFVASKKNSYHYMSVYFTSLGAMTTLITILVGGGGGLLMLSGDVSLSDFIIFLLYIGNFTDPIKKLVALTEQLQNGLSGYERFTEMMDIEPEISDSPDAVEISDVKGDIAFENVSFAYNENELVFENLNLRVPAGEYVALVGSSGVGKTTLCSLIPRFYDVSSGRLTLDGHDVRDITLDSLRSQIGIVQQDIYLFSGTVMDNIRYGRPQASDEDVIEASKLAGAYEFIQNLPDGFNTDVGHRGVRLSGGQKQRLAIARVFLKNPRILIFDEATSALDNESERLVQASLERLAKERTTFVIAHRLSTVLNAQRILVLSREGIVEQGTHAELMQLNGVYASLYRSAEI
ncbi:MAG: ABC transporter ATP-binding protein [Clostridia bacterium]|nr:ABC transporter ATP-binding protein [Clostridia bacterium]